MMESGTPETDHEAERLSKSLSSEPQQSGEDESLPPTKWRKNTPDERKMYQKRRKHKKRTEKKLKHAGRDEELSKVKNELKKYKGMARTFWDRWQWELLKRREALQNLLEKTSPEGSYPTSSSRSVVPSIDPASLHDPTIDGRPTEVYLGRGSFSVVRLQFYRGMKVAVKEFLPRSIKSDVANEATILSLLNHPYLPHIFGMCTSSQPHRIVLQFHGIDSETVTIGKELAEGKTRFSSPVTWFLFCSQILDAMHYLHDHVKVIHNDIKGDNILIATLPSQETSVSTSVLPSADSKQFCHHIVVVDFGKAVSVATAKRYDLLESDRAQYLTKYPHIAPEVVYGESKQSQYSDMYSVGRLFRVLADSSCFNGLPEKDRKDIHSLIDRLTAVLWNARPTAGECLSVLDKLFL